MDGLGTLIAIATFIMAIVALNKISKLDTRIAQLKISLGQIAGELDKIRGGGGAPTAPEQPVVAVEPVAVPEAVQMSEPVVETPVAAMVAAAAVAESSHVVAAPTRDVEQALASRWFVWIGGAAIAIGGLLFVKYAYDNQLISPTLQIALGLLAGAVLVAGGEFVRRKSAVSAAPDYVPAALSAAGIVTAFGSIYAAYGLYHLVEPKTAFAGLAIVALAALALSRLQGPLIAALGLIGSYVTPILVSTPNPLAWNFFPYLLVILVASFATLRGRNWWWLGFAAIAGSAGWTALCIAVNFVPADTLPVGLFALAIAFIAVLGPRGLGILDEASGDLRSLKTISAPLAIGLAGLATAAGLLMGLVNTTSHGQPALILFFVTVGAALVMAWRKRGVSPIAVVAAGLSFLTLMVWSDAAIYLPAVDENQVWTTVPGPAATRFLTDMMLAGAAFVLIGCLGARLQQRPRSWGLMGGASAALFVAGAYSRVDQLLTQPVWAGIAAGTALLLLATAFAGRGRHDEAGPNLASGLLSLGAAFLLVFALDRLLDDLWLKLAIAGLAVVFAAMAVLMRVWLQAAIAAALGSLVTIMLFVSRELWQDERNLPWGRHWPIYGYGLPAVLFLVASRVLKTAGYLRSAVTLEGLSLGLAISLASLELRVLIAGGIATDAPQFLEMSAHILTWLGAAFGLMYRQQLYSCFISKWGARLLIAAACAGIVLFSLATLNPVVTGEPVQGNVAFNALLLAYVAPLLLIGLISRKLDAIGWGALRPVAGALALLLAFVYLTLETKFVFQGHAMQIEALTLGENYAYSAVWLGFALALFVAGLRLARQYIRYAGLGVMVLVVLKVFLWDMSSLEGLYRIASFVGLGLCLVGIGWLYQRFVQKPMAASA